jgi:hypothetical protein
MFYRKTLIFNRVQYALFSGFQKEVSHADMLVGGVTYGITAGEYFDKIVVDEGDVYFWHDGNFYMVEGGEWL